MKTESRLKYVNGYGAHYFYIDSSCLDSDIEYIRDNGILNIIINGRDGYTLQDIDWLQCVGEQIEKIVITPPSKNRFSYDGLKFCVKLIKLKINNYSADVVDLSSNVSLIDLDLLNCSKLVGIERLVGLQSLVLNNVPKNLLSTDVFSNFRKLKFLCVSDSDLSEGLGFLDHLQIERLDIYGCKKMSLWGISCLGIESLNIEKCKSIMNMEQLYLLSNLKELKIIDSDKISTADEICKLKNLDKLIVLGSSYFESGDLSCLKNKLSVFNYDDKKNYNIKHKDFVASHLKQTRNLD